MVAFVVIGEVGQTLPPSAAGPVYPVEWWNWATLFLSAALIGLVVVWSTPAHRAEGNRLISGRDVVCEVVGDVGLRAKSTSSACRFTGVGTDQLMSRTRSGWDGRRRRT